MVRSLRVFLVFACLLAAVAQGADLSAVRIVVAEDVLADYERWLGKRDPLALTRYDGPHARRDVVEVALVQQALALGGSNRPVTFVTVPTYPRMLAMVANGHGDLLGSTAWQADIEADPRLQASAALVPNGSFIAAIYYPAGDPGVARRVGEADWASLTAVSSRAWGPDWQALQALGLRQLTDVPEWSAMLRMVDAGRADFLLAPFQPGEAPLQAGPIRLVPVPGACLALAGSRHIAIRREPATQGLAEALDRGLAELRRRGQLQRAYRESGFLSAGERRCRVLNTTRADR